MGKNQEERKTPVIVVKKRRTFSPPSLSEKTDIITPVFTEPRQPGGCKLKTAPVRPVVAARPAEYVCSEDLFY